MQMIRNCLPMPMIHGRRSGAASSLLQPAGACQLNLSTPAGCAHKPRPAEPAGCVCSISWHMLKIAGRQMRTRALMNQLPTWPRFRPVRFASAVFSTSLGYCGSDRVSAR